jgi:hypothetical protein
MKLLLGGKFESSAVRDIDAVVSPDRNVSMSGYYMGLNRKVPKSYSHRLGTLIALAEEILVPQIDWNYPYGPQYRRGLEDIDLGIASTTAGGNERDSDTGAFIEILLGNNALSPQSWNHISYLATDHYNQDQRKQLARSEK